jgi:hypothetical protein
MYFAVGHPVKEAFLDVAPKARTTCLPIDSCTLHFLALPGYGQVSGGLYCEVLWGKLAQMRPNRLVQCCDIVP